MLRLQSASTPKLPPKTKRLGEVLLAHSVIGEEQLETALAFQRAAPGKLLGTVLQELGYVSSLDLIEALTARMQVVKPFGGG